MSITTNPQSIQAAVRYLASCCDGAFEVDGQGFNKFDTVFGKSLAQQESWTAKQMDAAIKMLVKYKKQLSRAGFDIEALFDKEKQQVLTTVKQAKKEDKTATLSDNIITIRFRYNEATKEIVKTIPGRRFVPSERYWTCPVSVKAYKILRENGFLLDENSVAWLSKVSQETAGETAEQQPEDKVVDMNAIRATVKQKLSVMRKQLYPYQEEGVAFIESRNGRALIADEMGLGKTLQALAYLAINPEKRPAIILVPAHLKLNWEREINTSFKKLQNVQVLNGITPTAITGDIVIVNYDILSKWLEALQKINAQVLVMDEAHYIKSNTAIRTKATKKLAKGIPHVIALTGTPIVNRPIEGYNIVEIVDRTIFPNRWQYARRYCDAHHNGFGWDFTGASNKDELHAKLTETIMIRRKKKAVLPELPDKQFSFFPVEIDNKQEYKKAMGDFINYLKETKGTEAANKAKDAEHLVRIEALKQLAVAGKMKQAIQWIEDYLDTNGQKLVVFATHKIVIDTLMEKFRGRAVKVDGSVSSAQKDQAEQAFQNNPDIKLFVGNIKAAGTGLTLTAASAVAFLELPWTPGDLVQAEDRCHRIGQKEAVNIYYLLAHGTIEEDIAELLDEKREVLDAVLDGGIDKERPELSISLKDLYDRFNLI